MICWKSYSFRIRFPEEYAFTKTFESVFDEDTFFNSCLLCAAGRGLYEAPPLPVPHHVSHGAHLLRRHYQSAKGLIIGLKSECSIDYQGVEKGTG